MTSQHVGDEMLEATKELAPHSRGYRDYDT